MKYALVNGKRLEAQPGLIGTCELHGCSVQARCGEKNIWHWAHIGKPMCDPWWEPETPWHKAWKGHFPNDWHEVIHYAENGEKNIADVKTNLGYVIEFQHSHLHPQERRDREAFYQNMVWVVDGTRLKRDYPRFLKRAKNFSPVPGLRNGYFLVHFPEECFPPEWVGSSVEVIFDFQGDLSDDKQDQMRNILWCLLPGRAGKCAVLIAIPRQTFISTVLKQPRLLPEPAHEFVNAIDKMLGELKKNEEQRKQKQIRKPCRPSKRL